ncbi:MAG: cyclic nucleotide-binding domain-containing protein [Acidimicrobiales bacterium]
MIGFDGLEFLALLGTEYRQKFLDAGEDVQFDAGDRVLIRGKPSDSIYIVTEGVLDVRLGAGSAIIGRIGPGGIVGEMSWILQRPPTADVTAAERTMALCLAADSLRAAVASDAEFGLSLWSALAKTVADRLAKGSSVWGRRQHVSIGASDVPESFVQAVALFEGLRSRCDAGETVAASDVDAAMSDLSDAIDEAAELPSWEAGLFDLVQEFVVSQLVQSTNGRRIWEKPRGYAGDWETIENFYRQEPSGVGTFGEAMDGGIMRFSTVRAVVNRRSLLAGEIERASEGGGARVTSMACGPAQELFDSLELSPDVVSEANLLDLDQTALDHVRLEAGKRGLSETVRTTQINLIKLAIGRSQLDLESQDLIYSAGLIDYFPDELVISLLNLAHGWLRPGGRVIFGNFHPSTPMRNLLDIMDWRLIYRTEEDMNRLYEASVFGRPCDEILWEEQHINLFAVGIKR